MAPKAKNSQKNPKRDQLYIQKPQNDNPIPKTMPRFNPKNSNLKDPSENSTPKKRQQIQKPKAHSQIPNPT